MENAGEFLNRSGRERPGGLFREFSMDIDNSCKDVVLNFESSPGGHATATMSMSSDAQGWALVHFEPYDPIFRIIGDFLQGDIGISLWSCDAILKNGEDVLG